MKSNAYCVYRNINIRWNIEEYPVRVTRNECEYKNILKQASVKHYFLLNGFFFISRSSILQFALFLRYENRHRKRINADRNQLFLFRLFVLGTYFNIKNSCFFELSLSSSYTFFPFFDNCLF